MTDSTYPATGGFVDNTSAATFIPEIWSDEIIAAYQKEPCFSQSCKEDVNGWQERRYYPCT